MVVLVIAVSLSEDNAFGSVWQIPLIDDYVELIQFSLVYS